MSGGAGTASLQSAKRLLAGLESAGIPPTSPAGELAISQHLAARTGESCKCGAVGLTRAESMNGRCERCRVGELAEASRKRWLSPAPGKRSLFPCPFFAALIGRDGA